MRDLSTLILSASMDQCLAAVAELAADGGLTPEETSLRLAQFLACAEGEGCPEVAFDPTAMRLRAIDRALQGRRGAREEWRRRFRQAVERGLSGRALTRAA